MTPKKKKVSFGQKIQRFWRETVGELRKVTWPTPEEAWKMTRIVLVVMVVMAVMLGALDFAFSRMISFLVNSLGFNLRRDRCVIMAAENLEGQVPEEEREEAAIEAEETPAPADDAAEQTDTVIEAADDAEEQPVAESDSEEEPDDDRGWFVVHCYSGYENKVRHNLEQRIESMGMKDQIFDVVIPTQEEIEVRDGKRRSIERHVFPGYVLVNMIMSEESWYVVRNTPGVTGFVGMGNDPIPLRPEEVSQILKPRGWKPKRRPSR